MNATPSADVHQEGIEPYYDEGGVTIYHADCSEVLLTLDPVDLIFTSPPYNLGTAGDRFGHWKDGDSHGGNAKWRNALADDGIGTGYADHSDAMRAGEYEAWQRDVLTLCWAQLTDRGAIFYNHKPRVQASTLWMPTTLNPGLPLRQIITWARSGGMNFAPTHYVPTFEWIMVFAKPGFRLKSQGASGVGDVWRVPQEPSDHPAPFPLGLPGRAIESIAPSSVLDPFMGSGTTLRAAKDAGIPAVGIEISERYCEMAVKRLAQEALWSAT